MRTGGIILTIGGLVLAVVGCTVGIGETSVAQGDPPAKYIIIFGSTGARINLANRGVFVSKLKGASWRRGIAFNPVENGLPADATGTTQGANTVHLRTITQNQIANPNNQQVTQRVGFRHGQEQLMNALLAQVKE